MSDRNNTHLQNLKKCRRHKEPPMEEHMQLRIDKFITKHYDDLHTTKPNPDIRNEKYWEHNLQ